jgi:methionyl-tRNA formyltransferase
MAVAAHRIVVLTGDGIEHRYVAARLCEAFDVDLVVVDRHVRPPSLRRAFRGGVRHGLGRLAFAAFRRATRDAERRERALHRVLGDPPLPAARSIEVDGINSVVAREAVDAAAPDILLVFGTTIVGPEMLALARRVALNLHTGVSPRYRGTDCAFWPLVNREPEWLGATVHECTADVDGGRIFGVARAHWQRRDGIHELFARAVAAGAELYVETLVRFLAEAPVGEPQDLRIGKEYRGYMRTLVPELRARWALRRGLLAPERAGSYASRPTGIPGMVRHAAYLYARKSSPELVDQLLGRLRDLEVRLADNGFPLVGRRVLEIGSGQLLGALAYLSRANDAVGIDLDVIPQGLDVRAYARMLRVNGPRRVAKTAIRKSLRVDARYRSRLSDQIGRIPKLDVRQMSADHLEFPDESFDFVYCDSVLQHVPDARRVLAEIGRTLAAGGFFFAEWHLYTSKTGSLDPRALTGELPHWAHLRPGLADGLTPTAYVNRLRLPDWQKLFAEELPGAELELAQPDREELELELAGLHAEGELLEYGEDELLTQSVSVLWRKPADADARELAGAGVRSVLAD